MGFDNMSSIYTTDSNEDIMRWVEVPDDYLKTDLMDVEKQWMAEMIGDDKEAVLEIGVEFYDQNFKEWPSSFVGASYALKYELEMNKLKVGDIVDAKDSKGEWYEAVVMSLSQDQSNKKVIFVKFIGFDQ